MFQEQLLVGARNRMRKKSGGGLSPVIRLPRKDQTGNDFCLYDAEDLLRLNRLRALALSPEVYQTSKACWFLRGGFSGGCFPVTFQRHSRLPFPDAPGDLARGAAEHP
jgi:hypothetical protein